MVKDPETYRASRVTGETRRRLARITARAENHLCDIEWRVARLGALVASGQVDRSLIVERLRVAIELARLVEAVLPRATKLSAL
jgi:hypothetical protein